MGMPKACSSILNNDCCSWSIFNEGVQGFLLAEGLLDIVYGSDLEQTIAFNTSYFWSPCFYTTHLRKLICMFLNEPF